MGFNTYVVINNDSLDRLDDPDFGKILRAGIMRHAGAKDQTRVAGLVGTVIIMAQEHSDTVLVLAAGSQKPFLGSGSHRDSPHELLKKAAEQHGYALTRHKGQRPYPHIVDECTDCQQIRSEIRPAKKLVSVADTVSVKDEVKTRKR